MKKDPGAPPQPITFDELEAKALETVLELVDEAINDFGACVCEQRGRCGHCRLATIPILRAKLLAAQAHLEQHANLVELAQAMRDARQKWLAQDGADMTLEEQAISLELMADLTSKLTAQTMPPLPDLTAQAAARIRVSLQLAQLRGLPKDLEHVKTLEGRTFRWNHGIMWAPAGGDPELCDALVLFSRLRPEIIELLGRPAE